MNLSLLPTELLYQIFFKLPLENIQSTSCVCKTFSEILQSPTFWKNYLPLVVPNNASCQFLEKYGSQLSIKQLVVINFNKYPKKIELTESFKDEKVKILYKLIFSIRALEKFTREEAWEHFASQRPYAHLLFCWGNKEFAFEMDLMKRGIKQTEEGKQAWQKAMKSDLCSNTDTLLLENENYESCCVLFSQCQFYLGVEAPEESTTFFTELWKHYAPLWLDPLPGFERVGNIYTFMPIEPFTGFCNAVSTKKEFGPFRYWYLANDHLSEFTTTFRECKVESLDICLLPDVRRETLELFIEMVKKEDQFLDVRVDFMAPAFPASRNLFKALEATSFTHIKRWTLFEG